MTIVGAGAALCSMASFTPQAWKVIKTRETDGLSAGMYSLTVAAFALWLGYGALLGDWALIIPNLVCLLLSAFILAMILMPTKQANVVADRINDTVKPKG